MALKKQTVVLPFNKGLEQKEGNSQTVAGSLAEATNIRFERTGQIAHRHGFKHATQLTTSGAQVGKAYGAGSYKDEAIMFNGFKAYATIENSDAYRLAEKGNCSAAEFKQDYIAANTNAYQSAASVAVVGDLAVYAWVEVGMSASGTSYKIMASMKDRDNNAQIIAPTQLATESIVGAGDPTAQYKVPAPQVHAMGGYVYIVAYQSSAIRYWKLNLNSGAIPTSISTSSTAFPSITLGTAGKPAFSSDTIFTSSFDAGGLVLFYIGDNSAASGGSANDYMLAIYTDSGSGVLTLDAGSAIYRTGTAEVPAVLTASSDNNTDPKVCVPVVRCLNKTSHTTTDASKVDSNARIVIMYTYDDGDPSIYTSVLSSSLAYQSNLQHKELISNSHLLAGSVLASGSTLTSSDFYYVIEHGTSGSAIFNPKSAGTNPSGSPLQQKVHGLRKGYVNHSSGGVHMDAADFVTNASLVTDLMYPPDTSTSTSSYSNLFFGVSMHNGNAGYRESSRTIICDIDGKPVAASLFGEATSSTSEQLLYMASTNFYRGLAGNQTIYDGARLHYGAQRVTHLGDRKYFFGLSKFIANHEFLNTNILNATTATVDFQPDRYMPSVQAGNSLVVAGGLLWHYAGDYFKELGFLFAPTFKSTSSATGSGNIPEGTYLYQAVYEWTDVHGNLQQSAPSEQESITNTHATSNTNTLVVYGLQLTHKTDVKLVLYRTDTGGAIKYKIASAEIDGSASYSFTDITGYGLTDNTALYTDLNELAHVPPGSCTDITVFRNRIFAVGTDNAVYYSSTLTPGISPFFVATSQYFTVDNYAKEITGIENNVQSLVVFTENGVYYVSGEGPDGTGANGAFTQPKLSAPDQGMIPYGAHANTPAGVMFISRRGIYLVTRNMQVTYAGKSVEDLTNSITITDIAVIDAKNEIRFLYGNGNMLVYNYAFNTWSKTETNDTRSSVGIEYAEGRFFLVNSAGQVLYEDTGTHVDQLATVGTSDAIVSTGGYVYTVSTNWLRIPDMGKASRVYRIKFMGIGQENHSQTLTVQSDFDSSKTSTTGAVVFDTTTENVSTGYNQTELRHHLTYQKAEAIKVTITANRTTTATSSSPGIMLMDGLAVEVGMKPNKTFKLSEQRSG